MVPGYQNASSRRVPRTRSPGWGMMGSLAASAKETVGPPCCTVQVGVFALLWQAVVVSCDELCCLVPREGGRMRKRIFGVFALASISLAAAQAQDSYKLGPDSMEQPGVPKGEVTHFEWKSEIFPKTIRDVWVYVPAQYNAKEPACVMVFQDGASYKN